MGGVCILVFTEIAQLTVLKTLKKLFGRWGEYKVRVSSYLALQQAAMRVAKDNEVIVLEADYIEDESRVGGCYPVIKIIMIRKGIPTQEEAPTLVHELAHFYDHADINDRPGGGREPMGEPLIETIAAAIMSELGFSPIGSDDYVKSTSGGRYETWRDCLEEAKYFSAFSRVKDNLKRDLLKYT